MMIWISDFYILHRTIVTYGGFLWKEASAHFDHLQTDEILSNSTQTVQIKHKVSQSKNFSDFMS